MSFVPRPNGKFRSVVILSSWEETSDKEFSQRWSEAAMNPKDTKPTKMTTNVWPCLVDMDGRFLPNSLDVTESPGVTPPEPKERVKSPPRNVAENGYGGEDATVTPTRHKGIEHYKLGLPVESSVVVKRCSVTPTTVRGGLMARPNKMTVEEIRCHPESERPRYEVQWRPIQNFPRYSARSAVAEALPERCGIGAFLGNFWLIIRGRTRQQSIQQNADSQIIQSQTMDPEMNRRSCSENDGEAWVAERKKDLAELRRLTFLVNLKKRDELRRAAHKRHPQTHATVELPKSTSEERRQKESSESEPEDDGIVEHVQGKGESTQSWLTESVRKAAAYGRKIKSSDHDVMNPTTNPRDQDLDVITLKIVKLSTPQQRVLAYRQRMKPHVRYAEPLTRIYDDNENEVKRPPIALNKPGKGTGQVIPPGGYEYLEEEPLVTDTQEPYLNSDDSYESDDDGHRDCGRGGYHACPDNPTNYNMQEDEDDNITVIDIFITTQELHQGEDSETEPFGSGDRDSFEEDGFGPKVIEETK
jgi:hypothetical protein